VYSLVKDWDVAPDNIRVAVEKFDSRPHNEFHLNTHTDKASVQAAINNIQYGGGGTNAGEGNVVVVGVGGGGGGVGGGGGGAGAAAAAAVVCYSWLS
jgi:hypothetical protein